MYKRQHRSCAPHQRVRAVGLDEVGPHPQGRAAVMLGSTETTFYTIAVYFGAAGIVKTRYAVPAALCADLAGFIGASWAVRVLFYG